MAPSSGISSLSNVVLGIGRLNRSLSTILQSSLKSDNKNGHVWTLAHIAAGVSCLTCEAGFSSEPVASKTKSQRKVNKSRHAIYFFVIVKFLEALHKTERPSQRSGAMRTHLEMYRKIWLNSAEMLRFDTGAIKGDNIINNNNNNNA